MELYERPNGPALIFLREEKLFLSKNDNTIASHNLLSGGRVLVPTKALQYFYTSILENARMGYEDISAHENCTSPFRFFLDIDVNLACTPDVEEKLQSFQQIMRMIAQHVETEFMDSNYSAVIVFSAPLRPLGQNKGYHAGIHAYWIQYRDSKQLVVDAGGAQKIQRSIVDFLKKTAGKPFGCLDIDQWEKIIDGLIYDGGRCGLRLPGTYKVSRCQEKTHGIDCCNMMQYVLHKNSMYVPEYIIYQDQQVDVFEEYRKSVTNVLTGEQLDLPTLKAMMSVSLRCSFPDSSDVIVHLCPVVKRRRTSSSPFSSNGEWIEVNASSNIYEWLMLWFSETYGMTAAKIVCCKNRTVYIIYPVERTCLNKGAEHNNKTNRFVVMANKVTRRCNCKCPDVRQSGKKCQDWSVKLKPLPVDLGVKIFSFTAIKSNNYTIDKEIRIARLDQALITLQNRAHKEEDSIPCRSPNKKRRRVRKAYKCSSCGNLKGQNHVCP